MVVAVGEGKALCDTLLDVGCDKYAFPSLLLFPRLIIFTHKLDG